MNKNLLKTTQVAERDVRYEVYNRITGDAVLADHFSESEAVEWLNSEYAYYLEHCCCKHQYELLKSAFPLGKRKAGTKGRLATKKQINQWIKWWDINQDIWDAMSDENGEWCYGDAYEMVLCDYAIWYDDKKWLKYNDEGIVLQYGYPIQPPK